MRPQPSVLTVSGQDAEGGSAFDPLPGNVLIAAAF
jgi:hypothetical protein